MSDRLERLAAGFWIRGARAPEWNSSETHPAHVMLRDAADGKIRPLTPDEARAFAKALNEEADYADKQGS